MTVAAPPAGVYAPAFWGRNKWGWDRPNSTMTFKVPDANGDIGDDNKIIIEMVRARKRDKNGDFIE